MDDDPILTPNTRRYLAVAGLVLGPFVTGFIGRAMVWWFADVLGIPSDVAWLIAGVLFVVATVMWFVWMGHVIAAMLTTMERERIGTTTKLPTVVDNS